MAYPLVLSSRAVTESLRGVAIRAMLSHRPSEARLDELQTAAANVSAMAGRDIVIVGTGGSGRETLALLLDVERADPGSWRFRGFAARDEPDPQILGRLGADFLGDPATLTERHPDARHWWFVAGIGSGQGRRGVEADLESQGLRAATLVHPSVIVGPDVEIGQGSTVCARTVLTTNIRLGRSAQVNIGCVVAHDARVGDHVTFAQSVNVCGNVTIGDLATVFTAAMLLPGVTVGAAAVVGAGSVARSDVAPGTTVAGVPARTIR